MEIGVLELKQRIEQLAAGGAGRRRYPPEIRKLVMAHVKRRKAEGGSAASACRELGVHKGTIIGWQRDGETRKKKTAPSKAIKPVGAVPVRAVEVTDAPSQGPVVVLLGGARVEGLSIVQLAQLARALA